MAKRKSKINKVVPMILILLLLFVAIAGFAVFLKNNVDKLPDSVFYVKIEDKMIFTNATGYGVNADNALNVEVKNKLLGESKPDYAINIEADSSLKFAYAKDGKLCYFSPTESVAGFFDVTETDFGFALTAKGGSILDMLKCLYPDSTITVDNNFDYGSTMFWLTVASKDDVQSFVKIGFSLIHPVESVSFEVGGIVF